MVSTTSKINTCDFNLPQGLTNIDYQGQLFSKKYLVFIEVQIKYCFLIRQRKVEVAQGNDKFKFLGFEGCDV